MRICVVHAWWLLLFCGAALAVTPDRVLELTRELRSDAASARKAAEELTLLGPAAEGALPDLIEALRYDDQAVYPPVAGAIVQIGPVAVKLLQRTLMDSNFFVRQRCAEILGRLGPPAKRAAPALAQLLKDPQPEVQAAAENTLAQWGADAVPALWNALNKEEEAHRKTFIDMLGKCGPAAVVPLLSELQREENAYLRVAAAGALSQIQPVPPSVAPALVRALGDLDEGVRAAAADALGRLGTEARSALGPLVIIAHGDPEGLVRQKAGEAILQIGKGGRESLPGFIRALHETDENGRQEIIALLSQSDVPLQETKPILENLLKDSSPRVRQAAAETLGRLHETPR